MDLTGKQAHVLRNLERVEPLEYKLQSKGALKRARFQLDGWECTMQITAMAAKNVLLVRGSKIVRRTDPTDPRRPGFGSTPFNASSP